MFDLEAAMIVKFVSRCLPKVTNVQMNVSFILRSFDESQGGVLLVKKWLKRLFRRIIP